jgi:hypothetical protein
MMMTEMVFKTLVQYEHLTRLITREDYIKFSHRESSKTYREMWRCNVKLGFSGKTIRGEGNSSAVLVLE